MCYTLVMGIKIIIFICFVYFTAGIVDAICGGGGLFTVPALMSIGLPAHMVVGTNQCSLILGNVMSIYKYNKSGNIHWRIAAIAVPFTLVGAIIGSKLNLIVSERYLQILMLALLPVIAIFTFVKKDIGTEDHFDEVSPARQFWGTAIISLTVSAYHAFYGPGSGLFFMALYCIVLKFDVLKGNGLTKVILFIASMMSGITYAVSGNVQWTIVSAASVFYIGGNYLGATIAITKGAKVVKPAFIVMIIVLFAKLAFDFFTK